MAEESWPLSAALAWIACRRPLAFDQWDDAVFPPSTNATLIEAGELISEAAAQQLNTQNDGVSEALEGAIRQLFEAAVDGNVTLRGLGPYMAGDEDATADSEIKDIAPGYFTIPALAAFPSQEILGPGESVRDPRGFPRYRCVTVSAEMVRANWPRAQEHLVAWLTLTQTRNKLKRDDAISRCMKECECSQDEASLAFGVLPDELKRTRGRPPKNKK
jgi:hypothetical protein